MELAKFTDVIWDARNSKKKEITIGEETALEKAVAALTILNKKKWQGGKNRDGGCPRGGQGGDRGGGQAQQSLCEKHKKFGEFAHYCSSPKTCSWSGNE